MLLITLSYRKLVFEGYKVHVITFVHSTQSWNVLSERSMILLCCGENLITYLVTFLTCSVLLIFLTIQFKCHVTKNGLIKIIIMILNAGMADVT